MNIYLVEDDSVSARSSLLSANVKIFMVICRERSTKRRRTGTERNQPIKMKLLNFAQIHNKYGEESIAFLMFFISYSYLLFSSLAYCSAYQFQFCVCENHISRITSRVVAGAVAIASETETETAPALIKRTEAKKTESFARRKER